MAPGGRQEVSAAKQALASAQLGKEQKAPPGSFLRHRAVHPEAGWDTEDASLQQTPALLL